MRAVMPIIHVVGPVSMVPDEGFVIAIDVGVPFVILACSIVVTALATAAAGRRITYCGPPHRPSQTRHVCGST